MIDKEIGRAREVFCDAILGGKEYGTYLKDLQKYFDYFGIVANVQRSMLFNKP